MKARDIRQSFIDFFARHDHQVVQSASLIPAEDPTLLFTNAGMNQFKDVFTGLETRTYARAVSSQKCVRAGGKHNDLQNVGYTPRHHTFFEMLGNFSFGDYFKKDAIRFAWDFLLKELKLPREKLWVTVFREDDEAAKLWHKVAGLEKSRIIRMGEKDNFWSMGETGPCGPCSEIHFDLRGKNEAPHARPDTHEELFLEIWNLVFMQFNRDEKGNMSPLPHPSIDTGAGLERLAAVCQGVDSNYQTDLFLPVVEQLEKLSGISLQKAEGESHAAFRVITDHARCCAFLIADGVRPSNEGRGYVLRQIARRALSYARHLSLKPPFLFPVCRTVIRQMREAYPELEGTETIIETVIGAEEEKFRDVVRTAQRLGDQHKTLLSKRLPAKAKGTLDDAFEIHSTEKNILARCRFSDQGAIVEKDGRAAFDDFQTHGIPLIMQADYWQEIGQAFSGYRFTVDEDQFWEKLRQHRENASGSWKETRAKIDESLVKQLAEEGLTTEFSGHTREEDQGKLLAIIANGARQKEVKSGEEAGLIMDRTPFYGEAGGQVGDRGTISASNAQFEVSNTERLLPKTWIHWGKLLQGKLELGHKLTLKVDLERRATLRNHTATHLLHEALRRELGDHINQAGSLVSPDRLRFDFTHPARLTEEQLTYLERQVNERIMANIPLRSENMPLEQARKSGARALFGEKYQANVRVVQIGEYSKELCGGTHVAHTGDIGLFRIISEGSVASGVRRIEAVTGESALASVHALQETLREASTLLKVTPAELIGRIEKLLTQYKTQQQTLKQLQSGGSQTLEDLFNEKKKIGNVNLIASALTEGDHRILRETADRLLEKLGQGIVALGAVKDGKAHLVVKVERSLSKKYPAGTLIKEMAAQVGGTGGGRADMAQAGGNNPQGLDAALKSLEQQLKAKQ